MPQRRSWKWLREGGVGSGVRQLVTLESSRTENHGRKEETTLAASAGRCDNMESLHHTLQCETRTSFSRHDLLSMYGRGHYDFSPSRQTLPRVWTMNLPDYLDSTLIERARRSNLVAQQGPPARTALVRDSAQLRKQVANSARRMISCSFSCFFS